MGVWHRLVPGLNNASGSDREGNKAWGGAGRPQTRLPRDSPHQVSATGNKVGTMSLSLQGGSQAEWWG